jgi:UDP-N-acetylmuramate dehydrogenase
MNALRHQLIAAFGPSLRQGEPLAPRTWMRVGGPAEFLIETGRPEQVVAAHAICRCLGAPFFLLGGGSNVLVDDEGLAGLTVIYRDGALRWQPEKGLVTADAGVALERLVEAVSARGWGDLTFAAGIPGTVGGALAGGAGAYGRLLVETVCTARVLRPDGSVADLPVQALGVRYRDSDLLQRGEIVLDITFGGFQPEDAAALSARIAAIKRERAGKHPPPELPCAGSFFKNLPPPNPGAQRVAAGLILDRCGAKEMHSGGAAVFERHANIIVNAGGATAADILSLARRMADRVQARYGIRLEPEVRYLSNKPIKSVIVRDPA